eukprot:TRINITY_DN14858_c1_g3_i1.p1 TRINITY_DN14858_c1_g3~~TRINITY_DN14858_c1_g3_i1.p1  ORF type:complete len:176 (+),score=26.90 TRINITY_DN14858_c1_g3_i1:66-593(+)
MVQRVLFRPGLVASISALVAVSLAGGALGNNVTCTGLDGKDYAHGQMKCNEDHTRNFECYDGEWQDVGECSTDCSVEGSIYADGDTICALRNKRSYRCVKGALQDIGICGVSCKGRDGRSYVHGQFACDTEIMRSYKCYNGTFVHYGDSEMRSGDFAGGGFSGGLCRLASTRWEL